ncbi:MAG: transglutaminase domain-containing protein [Bacteroidota bacterium]
MLRQLFLCLLLGSLAVSHAYSDGWNVDSLARSIPNGVTRSPQDFAIYLNERFLGETERVKALFSWIVNSVVYDLNQIETASRYESIDDFVLYTLKTKKAVCQGYAEVFTAICNRMGMKALTVHGYNRVDGRLNSDLGHAWNVVKIDGKWYLFDPTWGSGYLYNGRYRKSFSTIYFMISPDSLIVSHMPFDPIWQLQDYPITHDQFIDGGERGNTYYNFSDSLDLYYSMDEINRAESTLRRAGATHANRREILKMYRKYNDYVINMKCNVEINRYNEASTTLTYAIDRFNEYQELRGKKNADPRTIRLVLDATGEMVQHALRQVRDVSPCRSLSIQEIQRLINHIHDLEAAVSTGYRAL